MFTFSKRDKGKCCKTKNFKKKAQLRTMLITLLSCIYVAYPLSFSTFYCYISILLYTTIKMIALFCVNFLNVPKYPHTQNITSIQF